MLSCNKIIFLTFVITCSTFSIGHPISGLTQAFSISDYLTFEPGHYIQFEDNAGRTIELVYQTSAPDSYLMTLTKVGDDGPYWRNSAMFRRENAAGNVRSTGGCPVGNQANFFAMVFTMPAGFLDGDTYSWEYSSAELFFEYIGDYSVGNFDFTEVVKVNIDNQKNSNTYLKGTGTAYLAKHVGIVDFSFSNYDGDNYQATVKEYGQLEPIVFSGRLTLDGRFPAEGFGMSLTNCGELGYNYVLVEPDGTFKLHAYGHALYLRYGPLRSDRDSLDTNMAIEEKYDEISDDIIGLELSMHWPPQPIQVIIDEALVSQVRADVGSEQHVNFHCKWDFDDSDASDVEVEVNEQRYTTNATGWISIPVTSNQLGDETWLIDDVLDGDGFIEEYEPPVIIWDIVEVNVSEAIRVDIGTELRPEVAEYRYDGSTFNGVLYLNDTLSDKNYGVYPLRVVSIEDLGYGLSKFYADPIVVIIDRVILEMSVVDTHIDVGTRPEIAINGYYEYDESPFQGVITINHPPDYDSVKLYEYTICCITDPDYGLESFTSNSVNCIWDRVKIVDSGVSQSTTILGSAETAWFKAQYEFGGEPFSDDNGKLWINDEQATWNNEEQRWDMTLTQEQDITINFEVTDIEDGQYGLSAINHAAPVQTIEWAIPKPQGGIPGYPIESIILGIITTYFLLHKIQKLG